MKARAPNLERLVSSFSSEETRLTHAKKKKKMNEIRPLTYTTHKNYSKMEQWFKYKTKNHNTPKRNSFFFFFGYDIKITTKEKEVN